MPSLGEGSRLHQDWLRSEFSDARDTLKWYYARGFDGLDPPPVAASFLPISRAAKY